MAKRYRPSRGMRNLGSGLGSTARFTGNVAGRSAVGLFRWATTDHSGMNDALGRIPQMRFLDTLRYIGIFFLLHVVCAILSGIWICLLVGYGIPFLITGGFNP